jgi:hypothetical protein
LQSRAVTHTVRHLQLVVVYFVQLIPASELDDHAKLRALVYQPIVD